MGQTVVVDWVGYTEGYQAGAYTRSIFRLNVSAFCGIRGILVGIRVNFRAYLGVVNGCQG